MSALRIKSAPKNAFTLRVAEADPNVRGILVRIDSSGGSPVAAEVIANGFKLAAAELAGDMGNVCMKLMFELQARDMSLMDNRTLLYSLDVISKTHERFVSKLAS